jgi:DNA ligase-1
MTTLFHKIIRTNPSDLINTVYLACNDGASPEECVGLGVRDSSLIKAIAETTASTPKTIKAMYKEVRAA